MKKNLCRDLGLSLVALFIMVGITRSNGDLKNPSSEAQMRIVSDAVSPQVAYSLQRKPDFLVLTVQVASYTLDGTGVSLKAGLAADKVVLLTDTGAKAQRSGNSVRYVFRVPSDKLVNDEAGWEKLRVGLSVEWAGGPFGAARQQEAYLQNPQRAVHDGLSPSPSDWQLVDLAEMARSDADARQQIAFDFDQPMDGKATIVIEDAQGHRVRNLISGQPTAKGQQRIVWDGADEAGRVVPPGNYHWRAVSHPGLSIHYLMAYCNGQGSNHSTFEAAATNGQQLFFGAPVTEGGFEIVQLNLDGTFVRGLNSPSPHGLSAIALAADDKYLYAVYDGTPWGQKVDRGMPDWRADNDVRLFRYDLATGNLIDYPGTRSSLISSYSIGPGSPEKRPDVGALRGMALLNGHLYLADGIANVVQEIDPQTGKLSGSFPLQNAVALAGSPDGLYAITGKQLVRLDPASGKSTPLATLEGEPRGLCVGKDGRFFVSDGLATAQLVQIYDGTGKVVGVVGKAGGIGPGPYDPLKIKNPTGLVQASDGHLWVTEHDRWQPKRLAAYDATTNTMWKEFFGPTAYGAPGASFDPANPTHWIGQNTMFDVDLAANTARPIAIQGGEPGMHYRFWRQEGRTFVIAYGKATYIEELKDDGTLHPLACTSDAHQFCYSQNWNPPQAFIDAFHRDYPDQHYIPGTHGKPDHGLGMLWVDKNGDGVMQADEIEFATASENFGGSGWGHDFYDLTLRLPATVAGKGVMVTLKPTGWWPGGAPKYPPLNDAVHAAIPIDLDPGKNATETTVDHLGNMILNTDPAMRGIAPDGHLLWTFPNKWSGVGGSHNAPLPHSGEMQGVLFYTGVAPLDDQGDVMVMNGNHGRLFAMTSDGFYLDEMFHDLRLMNNPQAGGIGILGGECFGGSFARSEKDGNYYYQGGGIEYRIYRIDGLQQVKRSTGTFTVNAEQTKAAERKLVSTLATAVAPHEATLPFRNKPPVIDGKDSDWSGDPTVKWDHEGQFPVAIRAAYDAKMLYLHYTVRDDSPWVNNGKDWQSLFKTGDSIDLQLGTDPKAKPSRSSPVSGDFRLLIAPFQGGNIAVLYRYRVPGAKDGVVFQSPWRGEKVDSVKRLDSAQIAITRDNGSYHVEVAVPLTDLGLDANLAGQKLRGDFGVIYGDAEGTTDIFRNYWANPATGLVNDVPGEIMLTPNLWGDVTLGAAAP